MKKNEYKCADCGGIFEKGVPEKEAWREYDDNFPGASHQTAEVVCNDCYQKMIAIEPPPGMKEQQETDALKLAQMAAFPPIAVERRTDYDWFHLKLDKPWWWKLLHPIKTRTIKKWMREAEPMLKQELEKMNYNKLLEKMLCDQLCYGTSAVNIGPYGISPAQAVMKEIKTIGQFGNIVCMVGMAREEVKRKMTTFPGIVTFNHLPDPRWRQMDIKNTHKDIIETEIKRKENP